ncbi:MAG: hypothetical protein WC986_14510 [Elusimicrobiota bacterium]|jgi:hypothetical protein
MVTLDSLQTLQALAKALGKPCMFVSTRGADGKGLGEILKAAPYLDGHDQVLCDQSGYLVFDTAEEMEKTFEQTVGDDGPTKLNTYSGPARVYAVTCGADGELQTENT